MRSVIEQKAVYLVLLLMLALMFLFGFMMAEKGAHALASPVLENTQQGQPENKAHLQILGKDMHGARPTWSEQLSRHLEGQDSPVGDAIDSMSLHVGTWLQAGSQTVLGTLRFAVGK